MEGCNYYTGLVYVGASASIYFSHSHIHTTCVYELRVFMCGLLQGETNTFIEIKLWCDHLKTLILFDEVIDDQEKGTHLT